MPLKWETTPVAAAPQGEENNIDLTQQPPLEKFIEFMLQFDFKETPVIAFAVLQDTRPWKQCTVGIKTGAWDAETDYFTFFKVDNKGQLFSWIPYTGATEKMAKAIAAALEQRFSMQSVFAAN